MNEYKQRREVSNARCERCDKIHPVSEKPIKETWHGRIYSYTCPGDRWYEREPVMFEHIHRIHHTPEEIEEKMGDELRKDYWSGKSWRDIEDERNFLRVEFANWKKKYSGNVSNNAEKSAILIANYLNSRKNPAPPVFVPNKQPVMTGFGVNQDELIDYDTLQTISNYFAHLTYEEQNDLLSQLLSMDYETRNFEVFGLSRFVAKLTGRRQLTPKKKNEEKNTVYFDRKAYYKVRTNS